MTNEIDETEPQIPSGVRYFRDPEDGGVQEIHGLTDDTPYLELGYVEITEAEYLAAMEAIEAEMAEPESETTE